MKLIPLAAALVLALNLGACATGPLNVADDVTAEKLIQHAQEAMDHNRYNLALQYCNLVLERFPGNEYMICTAEYEIAFIHYKQKKYDLAWTEFHALLERYDTPDEELLPVQFKVLTNIVLEQIEPRIKGTS